MLLPRALRRALAVTAALVCLGGVAACGESGSRQLVTPPPTTQPVTPGLLVRTPQPRPNVLVIEADDMRWDDLRFMPHVRRLIQQRGLSFENSFAPYPLCCPSRASFLTGQYSHNHHVYSHLSPYGFGAFRDQHTIATVLQGAGYRTALVGKYLNNYGQQPVRGTQRSSLRYVPPGWTQWYAGSDHRWPLGSPMYGGGTYSYFDLVENIDGQVHAYPGRYSTDVLAQQTRQVIDGFGRQKSPWFVWWTPVAPHLGSPLEPDDPPPSVRRDGKVTVWGTPARPAWVKGRFDHQVVHGAGTPLTHSAEADVSDKPVFLRRLPELTAAEKAAETEVTRQRAESLYVLDVEVARTLTRLRETGQLARTIVVFTSDNGYYLGEHRKRQGKINLHEPSLRVPLLIAGPGVPHGRRYDPVSTVDMAPTLAAYARTRMSAADGTSLLPLIRSGDQGWSRAVVTEGMMGFGRYRSHHRLGPAPLDTRGLRLGRWKLTRYSTGEAELYDLAKDPLELHNLAHVPRYQSVFEGMKQLYAVYADCKEAACRAPLPAAWQLGPAQEKRITDHEVARTNAYFGN
ncbi:MAG: sulfatase [Marmoricola sp.]|nr:sulfatase [Marmoricola sp.]